MFIPLYRWELHATQETDSEMTTRNMFDLRWLLTIGSLLTFCVVTTNAGNSLRV